MGGLDSSQQGRTAETDTQQQDTRFRDAQPLPPQLLEICTVGFEEQLYSQALELLTSTATSGNGTVRPAHVPPVSHLGLVATLTIHPSMTTRVASKDKHKASDEALRYLRHLQAVVGAENADLNKAFDFGRAGSSRAKRSRISHADSIKDAEDDPHGSVRSVYANHESIFNNAEDFWSVVGWAFNCSVAHPHRWDRWKLWLDYMLDVLTSDLEARHAQCLATNTLDSSTNSLHQALLTQYLSHYANSSRNAKRRLLRAILADGSPTSLSQFPPIWRNETALPKPKPTSSPQPTQKPKKRKLDLDHGDFGDYYSSDSSSHTPSTSAATTSTSTSSTSTRPRRTKRPTSPHQDPTPPTTPQIPHSTLPSRQRLLSLLLLHSTLLPTLFAETEDLIELYIEFLSDLALPTFTSLLLPSKPWLEPHLAASLLMILARKYSHGPVYDANILTQEVFEEYYAPWDSGGVGVERNVRMGVVVEALLRLLWGEEGGLRGEGGRLRRVVERGVEGRRRLVGGSGKREGEGVRLLEAGAERMAWIVECVEQGR